MLVLWLSSGFLLFVNAQSQLNNLCATCSFSLPAIHASHAASNVHINVKMEFLLTVEWSASENCQEATSPLLVFIWVVGMRKEDSTVSLKG